MKAFRNMAGKVVEIEVDLDLDGNPILPPDTTTDPRPSAQPGHYVTVVGRNWVQIPVPQQVKSLELLKNEALEKLANYRAWLLEQPVFYQGVLFDGDETARDRLSHSVIVAESGGQVPPAWVTYDNSSFPLNDAADLKSLAVHIITEFGVRFFEANVIRESIMQATDEAALASVQIPVIPDTMPTPPAPVEPEVPQEPEAPVDPEEPEATPAP